MFRKSKDTVVDERTGEIVDLKPRKTLFPATAPDMKNARTIAGTVGKLPRWINLKDHAELNGATLAIIRVILVTGGEYGDYVRIVCYLLDKDGKPDEQLVIYTGAENVLERALSIAELCGPDAPYLGRLKSAGNAWLLE